MSEDKNLTAGSTPSVAIGRSRRTTILWAVLAGLITALVSLLMSSGGSGASIAHAVDMPQTIFAKGLTDHECDSTEWHFVITGVTSANAPATITVFWANGDSEVVDLDRVTGGVAHYVTDSNLDSTVTSATATIFAGWTGQFNLSHGPCGPSPSPTPTS